MLEQTTTCLTQTAPEPQEEWETPGFWHRLRFGFQEALRHLWSADASLSADASPSAESSTDQPSDPTPVFQTALPPDPVVEVVAPPVPTEGSPIPFSRTLVLSDTDNDFRSVLQMLWLTGLCDRNGSWVPGLQHIQVVHTGDWLNKWSPNPYVLDGLKRLQETTPEGCQLILLNGNHELSILQMADKGLRTSLTADDLAFIRRQHLIHVDRDRLFLHGYPSTDLLMILQQWQREQVDKEDWNARLHALFYDGHSPLFRDARGLRLIGDIKNPKLYYAQKSQNGLSRGKQTATLLQEWGLTTVIHGHKPGSEIQTDHELREEIPGIRLINNDNRIRQTNWGGLLLSDQGYTVFINPYTLRAAGSEKNMRKQLCKWMGTRRKKSSLRARGKTIPVARLAA